MPYNTTHSAPETFNSLDHAPHFVDIEKLLGQDIKGCWDPKERERQRNRISAGAWSLTRSNPAPLSSVDSTDDSVISTRSKCFTRNEREKEEAERLFTCAIHA